MYLVAQGVGPHLEAHLRCGYDGSTLALVFTGQRRERGHGATYLGKEAYSDKTYQGCGNLSSDMIDSIIVTFCVVFFGDARGHVR